MDNAEIDIPTIARDRADNPPAPTVEQEDDGTIAECPHCGEKHVHGVSGDPLTHRTAHCPDRDIPGRERGYLLMRPIRGLLDRAHRWWKAATDNLGFSGEGPGLLPIQDAIDEIRRERRQDGKGADNG